MLNSQLLYNLEETEHKKSQFKVEALGRANLEKKMELKNKLCLWYAQVYYFFSVCDLKGQM